MKVSITMSEKNEFNWNFDEDETNERLISLENTERILYEKFMENTVADVYSEELSNVHEFIGDMKMSLISYGNDKDYNLFPYIGVFMEAQMKQEQSPLKQEFDRVTEAQQKRMKEYFKSKDVEIDESQFEVPDQNQKTL